MWAHIDFGPAHTFERNGRLWPGHGLAPSLLVALPYRFLGVAGAKAIFCIVVAALVSMFYPILLHITHARAWSFAAATLTALSLPYTMGAGQIYPDLLAGLLRLYLIYEIARGFPADDRSWGRLLAYGAAAGVLPLLHHRHFIVVPVFAAAFAVRFLLDARQGAASGFARVVWSPRLLAPLAVMGALCAVQVAHMVTAYGTVVYPEPPRFLGRYSAMMPLGLHFDQFHGLLFQNPLLFVALAGLPRFARRTPAVFALWCAVYALTVLPVSLNPSGYGGFSFAGRYEWDLAPLWLFPLGHVVAWVLERRRGTTALAALFGASGAAQLAFAWNWVGVGGFLIQNTTRPLWTLPSFYGSLSPWLPLFGRPEIMHLHWPNWIWVMVVLLAIAAVESVASGRRTLAAAIAVTALLALSGLALMPRVNEPLALTGSDLFKTTGRDDGTDRIASGERDAAGFLIFGPYIFLPSGCYEAALTYQAESGPDAPPPIWETVAAGTLLERGTLPPAGADGLFRKAIRVTSGHSLTRFEFRVWFPGTGRMRISRWSITPDADCDAPGTAGGSPAVPAA
jgi:hypothetical protein